jgi:hypothetical protein
MLKVLPAIALDTAMSVSAVLARLARYGLWLDPRHPAARAWIQDHAGRVGVSFEDAARRLARDPGEYGAAIRRQWNASVLWYSRSAGEVLHRCATARPEDTLLNALNLHEPESRPPLPVPPPGEMPRGEGVVLDGGTPVAVSAALAMAGPPASPRAPVTSRVEPAMAEVETRSRASEVLPRRARGTGSAEPLPVPPSPTEVRAWPRLEAPEYAPARTPFNVTVGLAAAQQAGVSGGPVTMTVPAGAVTIDLSVELIADGVDALDGWTRPLRVAVSDPTSGQVTFRLVGRDPAGPEPVHLTTLEVRYILDGAVCGTAARPLVIGPASAAVLGAPAGFGTPWLAQPAATSSVTLERDQHVADLTIEIAKPDRNDAGGRYVCRLYSPHPIAAGRGPHPVDFGEDAKTFAKTIVEQIRQYAGEPIVDNLLSSIGDLVAEKLPVAALDALREVARRVQPAPPAVLIVSAEPYVPWELARIEPPLDAARPPYLGAQALVGRWLRDTGSGSGARVEKPPAHPPAEIVVRHMAVMAGLYKAESGLRSLPEAEKEATAIAKTYDAVPLAASSQALKQLLDAQLERGFERIGGADAVHFAGHGDYDPGRPDSSVLFLSDGRPLSSLLFRSAKYGGDLHPLLFLNACMVGIGGELLGDMGGFPGNCLRGGFGGVLGALWEVDDAVARDVAIEFWSRALPPAGRSPEPVAAILRDQRARYVAGSTTAPVATYLAYVYYGHPRLTLQRTS